MGGIAALARARGHRVTGSDRSVYPPMSTQLKGLGIELIQGYEPGQLEPAPDVVVVGNVMTRGMPVIEELLNRGLPFTSGPQWLAEHVLHDRWVLAVTGTHGKTTTSSLLAWILEDAGLKPGFLIGGVPANFDATARLGDAPFFVIEADEYDTAFFDKRSKFVHLRPRTLVIGNLEHDHADIFPDIAAIQRQFHQLVRIVPGEGRIVCNAADHNVRQMLDMGCWTPREGFARTTTDDAKWTARSAPDGDYSRFEVLEDGRSQGLVQWQLIGAHNMENALGAIAAARHVGVTPPQAIKSLGRFAGVRRRLEVRGEVNGITVYDDFAHHPTAIAMTIDGLRRRVRDARIIAVLEPRSNTMRMGIHRETLGPSLEGADEVWFFAPPDLGWDAAATVAKLGDRAHLAPGIDQLLAGIAPRLRSGDQVLIMSNGGFGGLHERLLKVLGDAGRTSGAEHG